MTLKAKDVQKIVKSMKAAAISQGVISSQEEADKANKADLYLFGDVTHEWVVGDKYYVAHYRVDG